MMASRLIAGLLAVFALVGSPPLRAQEVVEATTRMLSIDINEGKLIRLPAAASNVFIANPEVADVAVKSSRLVYVFGRRIGETTLYAVGDDDNVLASVPISVSHNLSNLQAALRKLSPTAEIDAQTTDWGVVLSGLVSSAAEAADAERIAATFVDPQRETVVNRLRIAASNQVTLKVRVAEVSRSLTRQLGVDWNAADSNGDITFGVITRGFGGSLGQVGSSSQTNDLARVSFDIGSVDFDAIIDALSDQGLVSVLAEPNLTALSGETASFLAGGEFPIPVARDVTSGGTTVTIEWRRFGVSLAFTPTILADNRISMRVRPEVSELSNEGAVQIGDFQVPALSVRRAQTTVELGSGQSFVIAGLIRNTQSQNARKVPGLADIPVLGELFRSDQFQRDESELVIVVTPYLVAPIADPQKVALPTDATTTPQGGQRLVLGGGAARPRPAVTTGKPGLVGPNGFVLE